MGLDVPELDDRSFAELVEAARDRIPVHSDEWTDHNVHDPGITILEVLAFVAESDLYRLDRITDEHRAAYLALLDARPEPPEPATARLRLEPSPAQIGRSVPSETRLAAAPPDGPELTFETDAPVTLTDAPVAAVVTAHGGGRSDHTTANRSDGMSFLAFGEAANRGSAMYVGFEGDPFVGGLLDLGIELHDRELPPPAQHGDEDPTFEPTVAVAWEYCTDYDAWYRDENWTPLQTHDGTDELYDGGIVRLERPAEWPAEPAAILDHPRPLRWLRCTVTEPGHEVPPHLDRIYTNAATATHRTTVTDEELSRVDAGGGPSRVEARPEVAGGSGGGGSDGAPGEPPAGTASEAPRRPAVGGDRTTGRPGQVFAFEHAPVLDATIEVGGEAWEAVDSFAASGSDDRDFVLDASTGRIRFGDEVQGAIPEPGRRVVATSYDHGGGTVGNVSASADWRVRDDEFDDVEVEWRGGSGGRDAETIDEARHRLERDRATPYRTVTAADYRYVATHTPGLRFGRATAVVEEATGGEEAAGTAPSTTDASADRDCEPHKRVRVVVVPHSTRDRPEPTEGFLEAVRCHVEEHRLLTDRVTVEPPSYVGIGVRAGVEVASGYAESDRVTAVEDALDAFLDPLEGYDGDGWPFGRPVYRSELYEVVDGVEGVDCVTDVRLSASGEHDVDGDGTVRLPETGLAYARGHDVTVRRDRDTCRGERR